MRFSVRLFVALLVVLLVPLAHADSLSPELVQQIQADLVTLGYDPGPADGTLGTKTRLAIGQFEADHGLPFTGAPSFELAFKIHAATSTGGTAPSTTAPPTTAPSTAAAVPAAPAAPPAPAAPVKTAAQIQQECFAAAKQEQQAKKKRWGALSNLGTKLAHRIGGYEAVQEIHEAAATVNDVSTVAKEFGISEDAAQACIAQSQNAAG